MPKVAFATCLNLPEKDIDEALLLEACRSAGIDAEYAAWDDPNVRWESYELVVVRSTWNYYHTEQAFRDWISETDKKTLLLNPAQTMQENIHKSYLNVLAAKGIPIVPTVFVGRGSKLPMIEWAKFVVKPAISASSFMTRVFDRSQLAEAEAFLAEVLLLGDAMIQEFMEAVAIGGEIAMTHIGGQFAHGIIKQPRFAEGEESVRLAEDIGQEELDLAAQIMATVSDECLYARVDLMRANDDKWVLSELELIEPSLFFALNPESVHRFVGCLQARLAVAR